MSKCKIELRYDGPELATHSMDVSLLAPALMSFGDLIREANRAINGDKAQVKVFVNADIKANCVTISLDVIQSLWDSAKTLLKDDNVASAKELIDWLIYGTGGCLSLFGYLHWKKSNDAREVTEIKDSTDQGNITFTIKGDGNTVNIAPQVNFLSKNIKVVKAVQGVVAPIVKSQGIESATFIKGRIKKVISKKEAEDIYSINSEQIPEGEETQYVVGHIITHSPVFDTRARHWDFEYNGHVENIDIGETTIAKDTLARGKAVVGDTYKVKIEIRERKMTSSYKYTYKVIEVLDFIPGNEQMNMRLEREDKSDS